MSGDHVRLGSRPCACGAHGASRLVAVTGGPGSGKTALLAAALPAVCRHVALIPEAATIIFGGGFWRLPSAAGRRAAQRVIFLAQREIEGLLDADALAAYAICDRGTVDGLAYWPGDEADFWRSVGSTRAAELARYDAVIHLSPPIGTGAYNHANPVRTEDEAEAAAIDARILSAWDGHPRRVIVPSAPSFAEKLRCGLDALLLTLPACCR